MGIIPNGVVTEGGLIVAITFKAVNTGQATVSVLKNSKVLANDGQGTEVPIEIKMGNYLIVSRLPEGPKVFSETHPFSEKWYNNNPVLAWDKDDGVTDFSYELDNKPFTVPDNNAEINENIKSYENLPDGLWYFHIKAKRKGVWGSTTHFILRIDTTPPASFAPKVEFLMAMIINRALINFFTTDALSGINHYQIGVIEKEKSPLESPIFVQAESPYQLPRLSFENIRVIIRAIDNAGNIRDESIDIASPVSKKKYFHFYAY